jgi:hypothetical protein
VGYWCRGLYADHCYVWPTCKSPAGPVPCLHSCACRGAPVRWRALRRDAQLVALSSPKCDAVTANAHCAGPLGRVAS